MNKERILQLADVIEREGALPEPELGFNMLYCRVKTNDDDGSLERDFANRPCGTVGCIAGHALRLAGINGGFTAAAEWLGLSYIGGEGEELFFPGDVSGINISRWDEITPAHAAAVLRRLVETGKVEWAAVLPPEMFVLPTDRP